MSTTVSTAARTGSNPAAQAAAPAKVTRIACIDWMRGFVMVLMIIDHASMAFDGTHVAKDSALYPDATTVALPAAAFFTRWITHLCAPTFIFLAGAALAMSVERSVAKGVGSWEIDKNILVRGAVICLLDLTIVSLGSGYLNIGVLVAIGLSFMCMAGLRRLSSAALLSLAIGWMVLGEWITGWFWDPPGSPSPLAAFFVATSGGTFVVQKYSFVPWLAIMMVGWVTGRYFLQYQAGQRSIRTRNILLVVGLVSLGVFLAVRGAQGYGDMFLPRMDGSWQQWLHVSKYPPSLTYYALELGILFVCLWFLALIEPKIGVRPNGPFLVFGQTAMFFYLVHRLILEVPATYFGLRGAGDLTTTYVVAFVLLLLLYPACRWYRALKAAHPKSLLKYL
jgi:uncharacterized membrane protein